MKPQVSQDANCIEVAEYLVSLLLVAYPGAKIKPRLDHDGYWEIVNVNNAWLISHSTHSDKTCWFLPGTTTELNLMDEQNMIARFKANERLRRLIET